MKPYYQADGITVYNADCRDVLPELGRFDLLLTDPPYPDYLSDEYDYDPNLLNLVIKPPFICFWTAKEDFVATYDRVHIWNKKTGCGSQYERIFESGTGDNNWHVYDYYLVNSVVAASFTRDIWAGHKPLRLIQRLLNRSDAKTVLDPFGGSLTTAVACKLAGIECVTIEREERDCEAGVKRLAQGVFEEQLT